MGQLGLVVTLIGLGGTHPEQDIFSTAAWALGVASFSALQDVAVEAYRIESVGKDQQGTAASAMAIGWQCGVMASGAGALYIASFFSWEIAYQLMALLIGVGIVTTLVSPSVSVYKPTPQKKHSFRKWVNITYRVPFKLLFHRLNWPLVLSFILFFKVGDTVLSVMNSPFLVDVGFTKIEIAHTAKMFGISAMIVGGIAGGVLLNRLGIVASLTIAITFQFISSLLFAIQALIGHHIGFLVLVVGLENFSGGFGCTAFIVYLSSFCRIPYTATHFALLSSFGSLARIFLSMGAGALADRVAWPLFFTLTALGCLPCLCLLWFFFERKERGG